MEENITIVEEKIIINSNNNQKQIAGAILVAAVLIAGAILLKGNAPVGNKGTGEDTKNNLAIRPITKDEHILGNPNAKIIIVEYSDTECPFCKVFHTTMHKVVEQNSGQVAWVYRHYPIPQLHPTAAREAEATECAWEQGGNNAFWKYVDRLFEITPSNNGLDMAELPKIAAYVGLDVASFNTCLASGKYKNKVEADINDGVKAGVNGTPSSFILKNGKIVDSIPGAQPLEVVNQKIKDALR